MTTPIYILPPLAGTDQPLGLVILIQSHRVKSLDADEPETMLLAEIGRQVRMSQIGVLMGEMPPFEATATRGESIWARQKRILELFKAGFRLYPHLPVAVLAVGESAQCAAALMRRPRPETQNIKATLLIDVAASESTQAHCSIISDPLEFRTQLDASASSMWRRVVAESYAVQLLRRLSQFQGYQTDVRYA